MRPLDEEVPVPVAILRLDLSAATLRCWLALRREYRGVPCRWPTLARIREAWGTADPRAVRRGRQELLDAGLLAEGPDGYRLVMPEAAPVVAPPPTVRPPQTAPAPVPVNGRVPVIEPFAEFALEAPPAAPAGPLAGFSDFWKAWPHRVAKTDAQKAWRKQKCAALVDVILAAVEAQKAPGQALDVVAQRKPDGRLTVPHPATWLNARRWEDEVASTVAGRRGRGRALDRLAEEMLREDSSA